MKTKLLLPLTAITASLLLSGCSKEELAPKSIVKGEKITAESVNSNSGFNIVFDGTSYTSSVKASMGDKSIGYFLTLNINNNTTHYQPYGYNIEGNPGEKWGRMETMQLSSTLTAATLLKIIENKPGLSVDSPIFPYLPSKWKLGPYVKLITFRHLLTHKSGLTPELAGLVEPETDLYDNLRLLISKGIPKEQIFKINGEPTIIAKRKLSANYALMRILIPYVYNGAAYYASSEQMGNNAETIASDYVKLVAEQIFHPSGVIPTLDNPIPDVIANHFDAGNNTNNYARYYQYGNPGNWWSQDKQGRLYCGETRWYMHSFEYGQILQKIWNGGLLSANSLQLMKNQGITMTPYAGKYGTYYFNQGGLVKNGAGLATAFMVYPNGASAVLFINTIGGLPNGPKGYPDLYKILAKAYDDTMVAMPIFDF